jgi:uncharacterized OB-fold protein
MVYLKPLPNPTAMNEPFWEGLKEREFRVPQCQSCGDYHWVPYPACKTCLSEDLKWVPVSGDATVWSYSVVHRGAGAFAEDAPYVVVLAKLAEEPRPCIVTGLIVDLDDPESVTIGMPLKVVYEDIPDEDITMFHFAPAG